MNLVKDILVIRFHKDYDEKQEQGTQKNIEEKFEGIYKVICIFNENKTDRTEIEIIKY